MRLCTSLSLCLTTGALLGVTAPVAAPADATPSCAPPGDRAFPLATRIHGGPSSYAAGGEYANWYIDLTNTTTRPCTGVHPVVVIADDAHTLKPAQPRLDFFDRAKALPVRFESTDEQELVGVFDAQGFAGFTVAPGKTVTVKVRFSLASGTAPEKATINAAVVQRRGEDGEWVGESNDYRFAIAADGDQEDGGDQEAGASEKADAPDPPGTDQGDSARNDTVPDGAAQSGRTPADQDPAGQDPTGEDPAGRESGGATRTGQPRADDGRTDHPQGGRTQGGRTQDDSGTAATASPGASAAAPRPSGSPSATPSAAPSATGTAPAPALPLAQEAQEAGQRARELART
ncbi:hypothetical protein ACIPRD_27535, partial [Streptomyces sp. NPDC090108]|uniref:hypothetical protein n=1 Tax=Streptomyces sp. NPDC090108 TaxID=3365947 RepID=UPI00381DD32A